MILMLCLTREIDQVIYIENPDTGERLSLVINDIKGKRVRLGFVDPKLSFRILRKELKEAMDGVENPCSYFDITTDVDDPI